MTDSKSARETAEVAGRTRNRRGAECGSTPAPSASNRADPPPSGECQHRYGWSCDCFCEVCGEEKDAIVGKVVAQQAARIRELEKAIGEPYWREPTNPVVGWVEVPRWYLNRILSVLPQDLGGTAALREAKEGG